MICNDRSCSAVSYWTRVLNGMKLKAWHYILCEVIYVKRSLRLKKYALRLRVLFIQLQDRSSFGWAGIF